MSKKKRDKRGNESKKRARRSRSAVAIERPSQKFPEMQNDSCSCCVFALFSRTSSGRGRGNDSGTHGEREEIFFRWKHARRNDERAPGDFSFDVEKKMKNHSRRLAYTKFVHLLSALFATTTTPLCASLQVSALRVVCLKTLRSQSVSSLEQKRLSTVVLPSHRCRCHRRRRRLPTSSSSVFSATARASETMVPPPPEVDAALLDRATEVAIEAAKEAGSTECFFCCPPLTSETSLLFFLAHPSSFVPSSRPESIQRISEPEHHQRRHHRLQLRPASTPGFL